MLAAALAVVSIPAWMYPWMIPGHSSGVDVSPVDRGIEDLGPPATGYESVGDGDGGDVVEQGVEPRRDRAS